MCTYNVYFTREWQPIGSFTCNPCFADTEFDAWRWRNGDMDCEDVEFGLAS